MVKIEGKFLKESVDNLKNKEVFKEWGEFHPEHNLVSIFIVIDNEKPSKIEFNFMDRETKKVSSFSEGKIIRNDEDILEKNIDSHIENFFDLDIEIKKKAFLTFYKKEEEMWNVLSMDDMFNVDKIEIKKDGQQIKEKIEIIKKIK